MSGVSDVYYKQLESEKRRVLPRLLMQGTEAMREAGVQYLPKHPAESESAYWSRRMSAVLYPGFAGAVELACGLIFRKYVQTTVETPADVLDWLTNIDRTGQNVTQFLRTVTEDALVDGVSYVLVDYPRVPAETTLAWERDNHVRPFWVHIKASQILGWRSDMVGDEQRLMQVRISETVEVPIGDYGVELRQRIRVLEPGQVWVYDTVTGDMGESNWLLNTELSGPTTMTDKIPIVPFYTCRTEFFAGRPPFEDLAWKNVEHWQSSSDQRTILHVARVPVGVITGVDVGAAVVVGPHTWMQLPIGADAKYVEHTGAAIDAGAKDIKQLKDEMRTMSGRILQLDNSQKTAYEAGLEAIQAQSRVQAWALGVQACADRCMALTSDWVGRPVGGLIVNTDMNAATGDPQLMAMVLQSVSEGMLSKQTALEIFASNEWLPPSVTPAIELERLGAEKPVAMSQTEPPEKAVEDDIGELKKIG